jgi:hypothetical protein
MPFEEKEAKLEDSGGGGEGGSALEGLFGAMSGKYASQCLAGTHGTAVSTLPFMGGLSSPPYAHTSGKDDNRVYGPVDVIKTTHIRGDKGLKYEHNIELQFDYELRSYDGINGKAAMMDLVSNVLATCYSTGTFWGGGRRGTGAGQSKAFTNLPLWKLGSGKYPMNFSGITSALTDSVNYVSDTAKKELGGGDWKETLKNLGNNLLGMFMGGLMNKMGRPQKTMMNSLLTPEPSGFWHLTIGNPNCPIMSMGNMIMDKCTIQHYGPLGLDDFPTGLRVNVSLKPGKGRDTAEIEELYTWGDNRIYTPMSEGIEEMYRKSKIYKWKNGGSTAGSTTYTTNGQEISTRPNEAAAATPNTEYIGNNANGTPAANPTTAATVSGRKPEKVELFNGFDWAMRFFGVSGDKKRLLHSAMEQDQGTPSSNGQQEKSKTQKKTK